MRNILAAISVLAFGAVMANAQAGFTTKTYSAVLPASQKATKLLSADINGDGFPDLVAYDGATSVFYNDGSGGYRAPQPLAVGTTFNAVTVADMNGDSYPDVVGCQSSNPPGEYRATVTVLLNNGNGTFTAMTPVWNSGQCSKIAVANVWGNGHPAVITMGNQAGEYGPAGQLYPGNIVSYGVFYSDGTGAVSPGETGSGSLDQPGAVQGSDYTNCAFSDFVGGDFKRDGTYDLVITTSCQPSNGAKNQGTVYYAPYQPGTSGYNTFNYLQSVAGTLSNGRAIDLNGDGALDLVFTDTTTSGASLATGINQAGSFTFTNQSASSTAVIGDNDAADFNQDGKADLVASASTGTSSAPAPSQIRIFSGVAGGSYTLSQSIATGPNGSVPEGTVAADLNRDQRPDIAALVQDPSNQTTSLVVLLNTQGQGSVCEAPTTANTNVICTPQDGATISAGTAVTVSAASNVANFTLNRLYLDNTSVYETSSQTVSTPINAAAGSHHLVLVSYNNSGQAFTSSATFTVGAANGSSCIPNTPGVAICSPQNGATVSGTEMTVTSGAKAQAGYITAMRVYVDNTAVYTSYNPAQTNSYTFTQNLATPSPGQHYVAVVAYQSTGGALTNSSVITVPSGPCTPPSGGTSLRVCSPGSTQAVSSPFMVSAGATTNQGYIAAARIYIDNQPVATVYNNSQASPLYINQNVSAASGKHNMVVVAYPSSGGSVTSSETITVQ